MPFINDMLADTGHLYTQTGSMNQVNGRTPPLTPLTTSRFVFDPDAVMALLRQRILGQPAVLDALDATLRVIKADIRDPRRPLYVALLMGPTGVGKSEVVRVLAEAIHGKADAFCRIDMNTLAQDHYAAAITGAPPGYVGSKEGTTLLDADTIQGSFSRPGIVLFDEIEKAGKEVIRTLLNILDNGRLTLTSGARTIDFRNSLIFMTSNLGADAIRQFEDQLRRGWRRFIPMSAQAQQRRIERIVDQALFGTFDPEFINRIDLTMRFNWIGRNQLDALIDLELERLNVRLRRLGFAATLELSARRHLHQIGFDRRFGARAMGRAFRHSVEVALAESLATIPAPPSSSAPLILLSGIFDGYGLRFRAGSTTTVGLR